jgi:hypothetical protein
MWGESQFAFKDVDDELTIPTDLVSDEIPDEPPAPPDPTPPIDPTPGPGEGPGKPDAAPPKTKDAGVADAGRDAAETLDAGVPDAAALPDADVLARADAAAAKPDDAGPIALATDAGTGGAVALLADGGPRMRDGGEIALLDAGAEGGGPALSNGPRDPGSIIGMAGLASAGKVNVTVLVNMSAVRGHPVGSRLGPLFTSLPQWSEFLRGNEATFDPMRDTEWLMIYGPSLVHTERAAVLIRYSVSDAIIDNAVDVASKNYAKGGPLDAGVSGVKVMLGHADNAERAFVRAQPQVLAIVPPDKASLFAASLQKRKVSPKVRAGEALRLIVKDPHRQIALKGLKFPEELSELRLWVVPRPDGGADVFGEGDCTTEEAAGTTAVALTDVIAKSNSGLVQTATGGLLNGVRLEASGTHVFLRTSASKAQLERVIRVVAMVSGIELQ